MVMSTPIERKKGRQKTVLPCIHRLRDIVVGAGKIKCRASLGAFPLGKILFVPKPHRRKDDYDSLSAEGLMFHAACNARPLFSFDSQPNSTINLEMCAWTAYIVLKFLIVLTNVKNIFDLD